MSKKFEVRTDLAVEAREKYAGTDVEIDGVILEKQHNKYTGISTTKVIINNENGEKAMGKPQGTYITLESQALQMPDDNYHREVSREVAEHILELIPGLINNKEKIYVLVAGLGNINVTPDSLGPKVVENLYINRHLDKSKDNTETIKDIADRDEDGNSNIKSSENNGKEACHKIVSSIIPGVMAQTGMESAEVVRAVVDQTCPDVIIAVDSLAARSTYRVNTTIQITDTGINPGSGVGNHRCGLNRDTMGVPVIAIGVPTVVDAATIVNDTMEHLIEAMSSSEKLAYFTSMLGSFSHQEKYQLIREILEPHIGTMYVTPKDVDEITKMLSYTISEGINMAMEH